MQRFEMASALVERARTHRKWIGDDHGDRIEGAMLAEHVSRETREVWHHIVRAPSDAIIYLPIAGEGAKAADFPSYMNRSMPGIVVASPQAVSLFQSFQAFTDAKNVWLPELATITNPAKHDHLEVTTIPQAEVTFSQSPEGVSLMSYSEQDKPTREPVDEARASLR